MRMRQVRCEYSKWVLFTWKYIISAFNSTMFIIILAKLISVSLHKFQLPLSGTTEVKRRSERSLLLPVGGGGMGRGGGVCTGRRVGAQAQFLVQYNFVVSEKLKATSCITKRADRLDVGQRITLPARFTFHRTLTVKLGEQASKKDILHTRIFITLLPLYTMCSILQTK